MHGYENFAAARHEHMPWNKGKLTGAKPPFRPKHVWSIRTKLQLEGRIRDLGMFNLAIDRTLHPMGMRTIGPPSVRGKLASPSSSS
jgi:hypothetical protein